MWRDCSQTGDVIAAWQDNKPRQYDMIMRNGVVDTEGNHTKLDMSYKCQAVALLEARLLKPDGEAEKVTQDIMKSNTYKATRSKSDKMFEMSTQALQVFVRNSWMRTPHENLSDELPGVQKQSKTIKLQMSMCSCTVGWWPKRGSDPSTALCQRGGLHWGDRSLGWVIAPRVP